MPRPDDAPAHPGPTWPDDAPRDRVNPISGDAVQWPSDYATTDREVAECPGCGVEMDADRPGSCPECIELGMPTSLRDAMAGTPWPDDEPATASTSTVVHGGVCTTGPPTAFTNLIAAGLAEMSLSNSNPLPAGSPSIPKSGASQSFQTSSCS